MARPGIMIYFDIRKPLEVLPDADKGRLFDAILEYGEFGTIPEFDGMLAMAWGFIQPKLDRDEESYENAKVQRRYAAFCKKRTSLNLPKISFDEWLTMDDDERKRSVRPVVPVNGRYPTTTATATATSTAAATSSASTTTTATSTAAVAATEEEDAAAADRKLKLFGGQLGKGVVLLTDEQVADLLDRMDIDLFDYYVEKLSKFIIKNNAKVKNHYETILKWWREDSRVNSG